MADPEGARAPRQARHHAGRHLRPGDARKARKRDQELDPLHRRQGHQGGITPATAKVPHPRQRSRPIDAKPRPWSNRRCRSNPRGKRSCGASFSGARSSGLLLGVVPLAQAQGTYPDRPIRFVVAFPPGGATDTFFRQISNELGTALGQTVVIENKGGAGGYIALAVCRERRRPTATRCWWRRTRSASTRRCSRSTRPASIRCKDYDAVAAMGSTPLVWTVANNVPANNFEEFVAWSKTVPGKFNYGHAGPGSVSHLSPEVILDGAGMQAVPVPFKGGGPAAAGGRRRVRRRGRVVLAGRQGPVRRQARQGHGW